MDEIQALAQLRDVLANLYSDVATIRRVAYDAGLNPDRIEFSNHAKNTWQAVLQEAYNRARVEVVIGIARQEYSENQKLKAAWESYQAAKSNKTAPATLGSQVSSRQRRYRVTSWFGIALIAITLTLFLLTAIFGASIKSLFGLGKQAVAPTEAKATAVAGVGGTAMVAMSATIEAPKTTVIPPTKTPMPLLTASPLPTAEAKLISATLTTPTSLPPTETLVSVATSTLVPPTNTLTSTATPTPLPTPTPGYPCLAEIKSDFGLSKVDRIYRDPSSSSLKKPALPVGKTVQIRKKFQGKEILYNIWSIEGAKLELGWIAPDDIGLSPACPQ